MRRQPQRRDLNGLAPSRLLLAVIAWASVLSAQEYAWPTNASRWLTSTFGESRPRRFHAGFDIKTWNQTGYQAIAVRDGWIIRMQISPFGYGRALYVRLDTGEIAVYAHLQKFADHLQAIAEDEQERRGRYSIAKQFPPAALPVKKGEVIAYTGQSGIGVPHLHFELRNARNQPINPLRMGFKLEDDVPPTIVSLAVTPLGEGSMVDGDFRPRLFDPAHGPSGTAPKGSVRIIPEPIMVTGTVGLAVSAYDLANGASNRFSVYSLKLFVDEQLQFQSQYDQLEFGLNRYVELDRDYGLERNGYGHFYRLYKDPANRLALYSDLNPFGGALLIAQPRSSRSFDPAAPRSLGSAALQAREDQTESHLMPVGDSAPSPPGPEDSRGTAGKGGTATGLAWGRHTFRVEVSDYFGNVSVLRGQLRAGPTFAIEPILLSADEDTLVIKQLVSGQGHEIRDVEVHAQQRGLVPLSRRTPMDNAAPGGWRSIPATLQAVFHPAAMMPFADPAVPQLQISTAGADLIRLVAIDADSLRSLPCFIPVSFYRGPALPLRLQVSREFYAEYVRLEVEASQPLAAPPNLTLTCSRSNATLSVSSSLSQKRTGKERRLSSGKNAASVPGAAPAVSMLRPQLLPVEPHLYIAQVPLASLTGDRTFGGFSIIIHASAEDLSGQRAAVRDSFAVTAVPAHGAGSLVAADGEMNVNFWHGSLYRPLYGHVEVEAQAAADPLRVSPVYRCSPREIPLAAGADVVFFLADTVSRAEQLGVYYRDGNKWVFIDDRLHLAKRTVSARVFSLEDFALYRDNLPPELSGFEPDNGAVVRPPTAGRPAISVTVRDTMSGFASEESIVLWLDGRKAISEYDPERDVVLYTPKHTLSPGRHEYTIRAVDRSGNVAEKSVSFTVL